VKARWYLDRRSTLVLLMTGALLVAIGAVAIRRAERAMDAEGWVAHTNEVLFQSQDVRAQLTAAESGALHYVLHGDETALHAHEAARAALAPKVGALDQATVDNPSQQPRLDALRDAIERFSSELEALVLLRREGGPEAARVELSGGELARAANDARRLLQEFELDEQRLMTVRLGESARQTRMLIALKLALVATGGLLVAAAAWMLNRRAGLQQEAERRAVREAAHLRVTLDSCGDALIATDASGRVTLLNPVASALTGWKVEEARGLPVDHVFRIVNEFTRETVESPVSKAIRDGKIVGLANHTVLIARDGTERPIDDSGAPIRDENGEVIGVILVFRDVSARKRSEQARERLLLAEAEREAAVRANQAKDEFLAVLSHELRNPLAAMLGWLDLIRMGTLDSSGSLRAIESIERAAMRQKRLVSDLLDVSRIVSGRFGVERRPFDLGRVVADCVEEARPEAAAKGVELVHQPAAHPLVVAGDPERLEQVVENLFSNALKFTPAGGRIEVALAEAGGRARVVVTDSGAGIPAETLPRIFERFWQARTRAARSEGLGLGLAIVKHIVEEHGGTIAAESEGADRGARFTVELPLEVGISASPAAPARAPAARDGGAALAVLLVDDDVDTREALALRLGERGMDVTEAGSVAEAIAALEKTAPEVVVTDIGMPDADGFALLRSLRQRDETNGRRTPAIAVTGYAAGQDRREALHAGFDDHLAKPVEIDALVAKIRALRPTDVAAPEPTRSGELAS
jgi:PAS domain S-box-containing protein